MIEYESLILREAPIQLHPPSYERAEAKYKDIRNSGIVLISLCLGMSLGLALGGLIYAK